MLKIYIINLEGTTYYKVGRTRGRVEDRLKQLQTGSSGKLSSIFVFETDNQDLEKTIHRSLSHIKMEGEWFNFDNTPIERVIEKIYTLNKGLTILKNTCIS